MLDNSIPKIIKDNCFERIPANEKVWALGIPVTQMPLSKLDWQFDIPFWKHGNQKYAITPNQVLMDKRKYQYQYRRILKANLTYPIDIAKNKKSYTGQYLRGVV